MGGSDEEPITLSREDLYELAWSKPVSELAKDFGISDVALAKRCRRLGIPIPGRGYWARVEAGQAPHRPKLPKRKDEWSDQSALTVAPSVGAYSATILQSEKVRESLESAAPEAVAARIESLSIIRSSSVLDTLAPVKRTASYKRHPRRSEFKFEWGEKTGPMVDFSLSPETLDRAALLTDTLLRAAAAMGWDFDDPLILRSRQGLPVNDEKSDPRQSELDKASEPCIGRLLVEGEQVALRIEERFKDEPVEPTTIQLARERREPWYHAPRKVSLPTGRLRVVRIDTYSTYRPDRRSWYDRKGKKVEDQISEILLGFYELALSIKERREADERRAREAAEAEARRQELISIQEANQRLITQLERDAGAWHRARYLRQYVVAARKALGERSLRAVFRKETIDYLDWAERYVDQLDPLKEAERSDEFEEVSEYHSRSEHESMKKAFGRLLGGDWPDAYKRGTDYRPQPKKDWSYGERSVFEIGQADSEPEE